MWTVLDMTSIIHIQLAGFKEKKFHYIEKVNQP
jgi:hypothetical protein